jgi:hypothetical protein
LLDGWAKVEDVFVLGDIGAVAVGCVESTVLSEPGRRKTRSTGSIVGSSWVWRHARGILMDERFEWRERLMEGRQTDGDVISKGEGEFFTWKDIELATNKRTMQKIMNRVIKSDTTFDFAWPHGRTQTVDLWCKGSK